MSKPKPTALDRALLYLDKLTPESCDLLELNLEAARRELQVKTELCEADDAIDEMKFQGSIVEAVERRAKARDAYRQWRAEQEKQT